MTIFEKLQKIQTALKAPKNQHNSYGGYNYRSCEDIFEGLKPCMEEQGTALVITDDIVTIGDRFYVKAVATLYSTEDGSSISNTAYAREETTKKGMDGSQITGSSSSYARKYALNGLFCIDDTKDADTDEQKKQSEAKAQRQEAQQQRQQQSRGQQSQQQPQQQPSEPAVTGVAFTGEYQGRIWALYKGAKRYIANLSLEDLNEIINDRRYSNIHSQVANLMTNFNADGSKRA